LKAVTLISAGEAYRAAGDGQAAGNAWREALAILDQTRHPDAAKALGYLRDLEGTMDVRSPRGLTAQLARSTRSRVPSRTGPRPETTRETVAMDTPAIRDTSSSGRTAGSRRTTSSSRADINSTRTGR
jgi:hypothetical protein